MMIKSKNERIMIPSFVSSKDYSTMVWERKQRKQLILLKVVYAFCIVVFFFPFNAEYERKQCIADFFKRIDKIISV